MTIEAAQTINELNTSFPRSTDLLREGDDHIRMIKATIQRTFPRITGTINMTSTKWNNLDAAMDATASGVNFVKLVSFPDIHSTLLTVSGNSTLGGTSTQNDLAVNGTATFQNNITVNGTVTAGNLGTGGTLTANTVHATGVINSDGNINATGGVTGRLNVTVGAANVGGSTGSSLGFFAGDQTTNTQLMVKDYGAGSVWAQNWNYTGAVQSMDFNGLDIRGRNLYMAQNVFAGNSFMGTDGNIQGSAWSGDLKTYIVNNYLNDVQYQGEVILAVGRQGNTVKAPGGGFLVGIHQGEIANTDIWIEDIYYRNLVKRYGSGASYIIPQQP